MSARVREPSTPRRKRKTFHQTPKKPVPKSNLPGIRNRGETVQDVKDKVTKRLRLSFVMDEWQVWLIHRLRQGYDSILVAGTGYGKSLIFQGLAAMDLSKIVIVISPLKALERDQVAEAEGKGLRAVMINENTANPELWKRLRRGADDIYYVSPEMALGGTFAGLWQEAAFRARVQAVIVDEVHCIVEWGSDFRKEYAGLSRLRDYIGQEVPVLACTATCSTSTFNVLWTSLSFGYRPFWGLDVGCERQNLVYVVRQLENTKNPILDILNILPSSIPPDADRTILPKCIFYFETLAECTSAMETLRKILPEHLRLAVQTFVGLTSEAGKASMWDKFKDGILRILCATDAAGMGCNVPDIEYVALFCAPRSLSVLAQRWGRGGRDRSLKAVCFLFVQDWTFRPQGPPQKYKNGKTKPLESQTKKAQREKLDVPLVDLINLAVEKPSPADHCIHHFMTSHFRPDTELHTFRELNQEYDRPNSTGKRSLKSVLPLSWTILSLGRKAPPGNCCGFCAPSLSTNFPNPRGDDPRLLAYAKDFIFPLSVPAENGGNKGVAAQSAQPPQRPHSASVTSTSSITSTSTTSTRSDTTRPIAIAIPMSQAPFVPLKHRFTLPESQKTALRLRLEAWREEHRIKERGEDSLLSSKVDLPDKPLKKLVDYGGDFLRTSIITSDTIRKVIQWDLAPQSSINEVAALITDWRQDTVLEVTPASGRRQKKPRNAVPDMVDNDATPRASPRIRHTPLPQPVFRPPVPKPARMLHGSASNAASEQSAQPTAQWPSQPTSSITPHSRDVFSRPMDSTSYPTQNYPAYHPNPGPQQEYHPLPTQQSTNPYPPTHVIMGANSLAPPAVPASRYYRDYSSSTSHYQHPIVTTQQQGASGGQYYRAQAQYQLQSKRR